MSSSRCLLCGQPTDSVAESGLCVTCREASDETRRIDQEVGTRTQDAPGAITQNYGTETGFGVLPPGGYRYEEKIGSGGMGVVWRAVRVSTGQVVAIKKLRPECFTEALLRRFVAEARTLAAVDHPNVVRLQDFVPDPADPFLVLEFVPGESLANHLRTAGPLHPDRAARLIGEAAHGVEAAHQVDVIHRDLKPGNLLLTPDGRVKVVDFGLSKQVAGVEVEAPTFATVGGGSTLPSESLTAAGRMAGGTPGFMAPEQVDESFGAVGPPTDVWGLGATLHTLLTGKPPFPPGKENLERVLTDQFIPPHELNPAIPMDLSAIVMKCLAKRPADRYPSAAALAADLDRYAKGDSTIARPMPWLTRVWRRVRGVNRGAALAWLLLAIAVAVGVSVLLVITHDPLKAQQARLNSGKEAVLVENGRPVLQPAFVFGDAVITPPSGNEQAMSFASPGTVALAFTPDPGTDRFRITAELCQLAPSADKPNATGAWIGIFWAYRQSEFSDGVKARAWHRLAFQDRPTELTRPSQLALGLSTHYETASEWPAPRTSFGPGDTIDTALSLPGPWRTVVADVTPEGVTVHLPKGVQKKWSAAEIDKKYDRLMEPFTTPPGSRDLGTRSWSPRSPVGVFTESGRVAVRRFVLSPIPE